MRSKLPFFMLAASLAVLSCNGPGKDYVLKVKLQQLTEANIYNKDLVYDVIFDSEELNLDSLQNKSRQLFLKAVDVYRNKKKPAEAVKLFKSSILVFPDAKTYYELGNALLDSRAGSQTLNEAINAYEVAQHLDFQPSSGIAFRKACADYMLYKSNPADSSDHFYRALYSLRDAFSNGFNDTAAIRKDPRINGILASDEYQAMLIEMAVKNIKPGNNRLFNLYSRSFPVIPSGHFEIGKEDVAMREHKVSISYDFSAFIPEMQNSSFSREVSHDYFYVGKLAETPRYTALIYSSVNFYGEDMQPVSTTLAIYDKEGNSISRKLISCQCSAEKIRTVAINNNEIVIEDFRRIWDKPVSEVSFENNTVQSYDHISTAKYSIDESGKIVDKDVPVNYSDSNIVASSHE